MAQSNSPVSRLRRVSDGFATRAVAVTMGLALDGGCSGVIVDRAPELDGLDAGLGTDATDISNPGDSGSPDGGGAGDAATDGGGDGGDAADIDGGAGAGGGDEPGYYVDPLHGSMSNPGTSAQPWSTLEAVFAANKTFVPGDRIYLRRGYHGGPTIKGANTGVVTILAQAGHAPVMKWVKFSGAKKWILQDVFINPEVAPADSQSTLIELLATSTDNIVRNVGAYSTQDPYGWRENEQAWLSRQKTGLNISSGGNNRIERVHLMNVGNGILVGSTGNVIDHTTLENFTRDGWVPLANNNTWQYSTIMNAIMTDHSISIFSTNPERLHRDMVQTWNGARSGMVFRGNLMIAVADPSLPIAGNAATATGYIDKRIPVFAGWDGPFRDYVFENNVIFSDHQAGIWLKNATNCRIVNNTATGITGAISSGFPAIKIIGSSAGNYVYNNIANSFDIAAGFLAGSGNNLTGPAYASTYLAQAQPMADVRLKSSAAAAIGQANDAYAPAIDADGNVRSATQRDIGAYEYGTWTSADTTAPSTPGVPLAVSVPGVGVDLAWAASTDNRGVNGYDVYRNGAKVGRTRNGARFFDVYTGAAAVYAVEAFDASGNRSPRRSQ